MKRSTDRILTTHMLADLLVAQAEGKPVDAGGSRRRALSPNSAASTNVLSLPARRPACSTAMRRSCCQ
jgi:hypothetical protein